MMLNEMLNCINQAIINTTEIIKLLYDVVYHLETWVIYKNLKHCLIKTVAYPPKTLWDPKRRFLNGTPTIKLLKTIDEIQNKYWKINYGTPIGNLQAAFKYLQSLKQSHSKMDNIKYDGFITSSYITSPLFRYDDVTLLLGLKTRTVRWIKTMLVVSTQTRVVH